MKVRKGFVSNSSSSSFIISDRYNEQEILDWVKAELKNMRKNKIYEAEIDYADYLKQQKCSKEEIDLKVHREIRYFTEKFSDENIDEQVCIHTVKDFNDFDLTDYFGTYLKKNKRAENYYVLYDNDDNFLNYIGESIAEHFNCAEYSLHMG